jgi:hypothetical protein
MLINGINSNPSLIESIRIGSGIGSIGKINASRFQQDEKVFLKSISQEQKNTIVSEKLEQDQTVQSYNLRLQQNTPAAQILETISPYNDVQKFRGYKSKADSFYNPVKRKKTFYEEQLDDSSIENGFYMVVNDNGSNKSLKQLKDNVDFWREKINSKYHTGFFKEPGTLVNTLA